MSELVGFANYKGDIREALAQRDPFEPMGPGYDGEYRYVLDAFYDEENDVTKVGFTLTPPMRAFPVG